MPTYEYRCEKGHSFEAVQRMTDEALTECEVCGAPAGRVFSAPAVHFKGSGFYNTDYGKKSAKGSKEGSDSTSDSSSASDSSSSSDSGSSSDKSSSTSDKPSSSSKSSTGGSD